MAPSNGKISRLKSLSIAEWLGAVQRHPERPAANQRDVLTALAVQFIDWQSGTGIASLDMLSEFCGASRNTVQRSLKWAVEAGLLVRTKRGHSMISGGTVASEWLLVFPTTHQQGAVVEEAVTTVSGVPQHANRQTVVEAVA